jgi:hypothetical protein
VTNTRPCAGVRRDGAPCTANVEPPQEYCWWHDPAHSEQRSKAASKAAKSKGSTELGDIKHKLRQLADDVLGGGVDKATGSVVAQILGVLLRGIEQERKVRETDELAAQVEELRRLVESDDTGRRHSWG